MGDKADGPSGGAKDEGSFKPPPAFKISRQLDQEKIDFLDKRVEELIKSNSELRSTTSRNEKDTHDIVLYFQREIEMKDEVIARLNEDLVKRETQLKFEVERMRKKFEADLKEEKTHSVNTIQDLMSRLESAEITLVQVSSYRLEKEAHDAKLVELNGIIEEQKKQMFDALENQERRFLEDKAQLIKEQETQMLKFREVALKEAKDAMGVEAQKLLASNNHMFEELKFLHSFTAELQAEKMRLEESLSVTTRDISILADKELEYARQSLFKTKEIKGLRERVEHLEKLQVVNIERFKHRTHDIKSAVSKELEEALLDAAALRRLLQIKNKELRKMKRLAVTILEQRSDVEQYFLEALQEVKDVIRAERKKSNQATRIELAKAKTQSLGSGKRHGLPTINNLGGGGSNTGGGSSTKKGGAAGGPAFFTNNAQHLAMATEPTLSADTLLARNNKVDIHELSWADKELVLRVLFAKMNGLNALNLENATHAAGNVGGQRGGGGNGKHKPGSTFLSQGEGISGEGAVAAGGAEGEGDEEGNLTAEDLVEQYRVPGMEAMNDNDDDDAGDSM